MVTLVVLLQLIVVLTMIFIGASNAYRQVCAQPFVPTLWLHHHLCQYWHWLLDHIIPLLKQ